MPSCPRTRACSIPYAGNQHRRRGVLVDPLPRMMTAKAIAYLPNGFRIFTSSAGRFIAADHIAGLQRVSSPSIPLTMPPASRTRSVRLRCPRRSGCAPNSHRGGRPRRRPCRARPRRTGASLPPCSGFRSSRPRQRMVAAADMRQPAGDHAFVELAPPGDAQPWSLRKAPLPRSAM